MGEPKTGKIHSTYLHGSAVFFQCFVSPLPNVPISETELCAENLPKLEGKPVRNLENFVQQKTNVMKVNFYLRVPQKL